MTTQLAPSKLWQSSCAAHDLVQAPQMHWSPSHSSDESHSLIQFVWLPTEGVPGLHDAAKAAATNSRPKIRYADPWRLLRLMRNLSSSGDVLTKIVGALACVDSRMESFTHNPLRRALKCVVVLTPLRCDHTFRSRG